jgi:hypothetical protein
MTALSYLIGIVSSVSKKGDKKRDKNGTKDFKHLFGVFYFFWSAV